MKILSQILFSVLITLCFGAATEAADRALLVGVNYYQNKGISNTNGSVEDAEALAVFIQRKFNFAADSIHVLRNEQATAANIKREIDTWLIKGTQPGDRVFFLYSGHGFQVADDNGDEKNSDGQDEVMTPFDVELKIVNGETTGLTGGFIRDDEMNDYLAQLSGRSVVMLIDSCHSGTIARSISKTRQPDSRYLDVVPQTAKPERYSSVPATRSAKDLRVVRETAIDGNINGAVVISAAQPYQQAFAIPIPELNYTKRGALAYVFEKILANQNPTARQLDALLKKEMLGLVERKLLPPGNQGYQIPEVDVISKVEIGDQPLFGAAITNGNHPAVGNANYDVGVRVAMHNPQSKTAVKLNISKPVYRIGDEISYEFSAGDNGYLYVLVFSANNEATCVFPNDDNPNNLLSAGESKRFSAFGQEPLGKDVWVALYSKRKLDIKDRGSEQLYSWSELFNLTGLNNLRSAVLERTRGVGNKAQSGLQAADWQAVSVVAETVR